MIANIPDPIYEALASIYSPGALESARSKLRDTRKDMDRWSHELEDLRTMRLALRDNAAKCVPQMREFVENEDALCYTSIAQAEAKVATCARRIEELEMYLRRAMKVLTWIA